MIDHQTVAQHPASGSHSQAETSSVFAILLRRKGLVLFFVMLGLGGGYWYFTQQPETYMSSCVIEVFRDQASAPTGSAVDSVIEVAPSIGFIKAELTSDAVLMSAIEMGQLASFEGASSDTGSLLNQLRLGLQVAPAVEGTQSMERSIVQLSFTSGSAAYSSAVVRSVMSAYDDFLNGRHRETVDSVVGFFREARDTIIPQLNEMEKSYTEFRGTTPLEWTSSGEAINPFRQDALTIESGLVAARSEVRQLTGKLNLIEDAIKEQPSATLVIRDLQYVVDDFRSTSPEMWGVEANGKNAEDADLQIRQTLIPKVIQSDMLRTQLGENHPSLREINREIEATRQALSDLDKARQERRVRDGVLESRSEESAKALLNSYVNGLRKKEELLEQEITELDQRLTETRTRAHNLIKFENENASFLRRIGRYQTMLDSFDTQLEKAALPLLSPGLQVQILRPAGAGILTSPLLSRSLLMGGVLGAVLGSLCAFLIDWSERTYRTPDEIAQSLDMPILAHLPMMIFRKRKSKKSKSSAEEEEEEEEEADPFDSIDLSLTVVHEPHSQISEAIRGVRTGLFCSRTRQLEFQVIQITSAMPGDGKSTVVANLAVSIARAHKRVVIVDADLRRPTQDLLFGLQSETGLTSVLNGDISLADALCKTAIPGLDVLTSGPKPSNPAEATMLPEFAQLIDDLRTEYDMVIVDSPPLLACTDASNISSQVDGVIFVMRIRRNIKPLTRRATQMLRSLHVNLIGTVVNAIGDSGYSANYGASWSTQYGGLGTEYGYSYIQEISGKYLNASKLQATAVTGSGFRERELARASGASTALKSGAATLHQTNGHAAVMPPANEQ